MRSSELSLQTDKIFVFDKPIFAVKQHAFNRIICFTKDWLWFGILEITNSPINGCMHLTVMQSTNFVYMCTKVGTVGYPHCLFFN